MDKQAYLRELQSLHHQCLEMARKLEATQAELLVRKATPKKWSAVECIAHLNLANAHYVPAISLALERAKEGEAKKAVFRSGCLGGWMARLMRPNASGKAGFALKTFDRFIPSEIKPEASPLPRFLSDAESLSELLRQAAQRDISGLRIPSALGGWLSFRLGDALAFVIYHNQRHLLQAYRAAGLKAEFNR